MEYRAGESAKSCDWWNGGMRVNDTTWREFDEAGRDVLSLTLFPVNLAQDGGEVQMRAGWWRGGGWGGWGSGRR